MGFFLEDFWLKVRKFLTYVWNFIDWATGFNLFIVAIDFRVEDFDLWLRTIV